MAYSTHTAAFSGSKNLGVQVGHNSGQIYNQLYPNAEQPEVASAPSPNIPFRRDPDFVDHGTIVADLHLKCAAPASRIALVGLGGVGKSQLAIEYGHQIREASSETWVFWVYAGSRGRFEKSYRDIADQINIPGRKAPDVDILKLVYDYLSDERNAQWLLILDNVDDACVFPLARPGGREGPRDSSKDEEAQPLRAYLPQSKNGRILITSRSKSVAVSLVEESEVIAVAPMAEPDALALFVKKLKVPYNREDVTELAAFLEFMPLAIAQAAAYISQRAPRYSVRKYIEDFRKSDRKKNSLLNYESGHLRRDLEAKNSIIVTWQISFEHITQVRSSAADLLSLMSFFDRQGIPESLLRTRSETGTGNGSQNESDEDNNIESSDENSEDDASNFSKDTEFDEDVQVLRDYCFISVDTAETFEMHALVQLATRQWLKANDTLEASKEQFIRNLSAQFPIGQYENWTICQALFPHVKSALIQRPVKRASLLKWSFLIYRAGCYSSRNGSIHEAVSMLRLSMEVDLETLGQEHDNTICSMSALADAYREDGQLNRAEELQVQVLKARQRLLGEEHLDTLSAMNKLAMVYNELGRWNEAEELMLQTLELMRRKLGEEHPNVLKIMQVLASTFVKQGRWKDAEELGSQTLKLRKRVLGEKHPETLTSTGNLALIYWKQDRYEEAEELELQTLKLRRKVLGEKHPDTLTSMANLASIYRKQDRYEEAEELELQTLKLQRKLLGEKHPGTLTSTENLAFTYKRQKRCKEAEELELQTLELRKQVLGEEHPDTLISIANLGLLYSDQGRWKEAEELQMQALEVSKRVPGEKHPDTLTMMNNYAMTLKSLCRDEEALSLMEDCVKLSEQVLGPQHSDTKSSLKRLKRWKQKESDFEEGGGVQDGGEGKGRRRDRRQ